MSPNYTSPYLLPTLISFCPYVPFFTEFSSEAATDEIQNGPGFGREDQKTIGSLFLACNIASLTPKLFSLPKRALLFGICPLG
jgi:hypothetical protein